MQHSIDVAKNEVVSMVLNRKGTLLATASAKGTLIRLWDTHTGEKWAEFRRGSEACTIEHLSFDEEGKYLTCTSDKATVHIFKVPSSKEDASGNTKSMFSMLSSVVSYAGSEWSFA